MNKLAELRTLGLNIDTRHAVAQLGANPSAGAGVRTKGRENGLERAKTASMER